MTMSIYSWTTEYINSETNLHVIDAFGYTKTKELGLALCQITEGCKQTFASTYKKVVPRPAYDSCFFFAAFW